tara:strand:+ start:3259 stop:3462 length:204 start_codon:yes stop_codon:yes gene_type:complete
MESKIINYLVNQINILKIEKAKLEYEYEYLLEYLDENNKYFNEDEDEDYLFRIKQFDDEIDSIRRED